MSVDPRSHLEALKSRRLGLGESIARLHEARDRLRQAEASETAALAAIGALGQAEVAAMKQWASTGAAGPAPAIDHDMRETLTRDLAIAGATADAARGAVADVDRQLADAQAEGARLARDLEHAATEALLHQFHAERAELDSLAAAMRTRVGRTFAALRFLRERAEEHQRHGRQADAMALYSRLETITSDAPLTDFSPGVADFTAGVPVWATRFEGLTR